MTKPVTKPAASSPSAAQAAAEDALYDYCKYHGLGNDYIVVEPQRFQEALTAQAVRTLCDRHRGVGSDGILLGPLRGAETLAAGYPTVPEGVAALRIFNPDGSEAEKSGNGLRIFARYLWEQGHVRSREFPIQTLGGLVQARVLADDGSRIAVQMGQVSFASALGAVTGAAPREAQGEVLHVNGREVRVYAATIGNPHCVVVVEAPSEALARELGPGLEVHPAFPNRTNVQFVRALSAHRLQIEIWERGAGYTLASGSSSCAAAAVACRLGLCQSPVSVEMPGGVLEVRVDAAYHVEMEGEVRAVTRGRLRDELLAELGLTRR